MTGKPNHWLVMGRAGSGKSTFASKMPLGHLVLDFDGRWYEQEASTTHHIISNGTAWEIVQKMEEKRPGMVGRIGTVIVDSGTTLLDYEQSLDRLKDNSGNKAWQNESFKKKADIMRTLSGAILRWSCSSLWIFHIEDSRVNGTAKVRQTIPNAEMERLKKHLNAILEMSKGSSGKREIKVVWCRYNDGAAMGQVIKDTSMWEGVPERLDVFLREYKGTEGYNGNAYSLEWLLEFLEGKGKHFASIDEMRSKLGIEDVPLWFDRNGWGKYIEKAGA